jgi:hypothetical protein
MANTPTSAIAHDLTFFTAPGTTDGATAGYDTLHKLAFFGKVPVAQQATPTDAASIIVLLQAYGLCP